MELLLGIPIEIHGCKGEPEGYYGRMTRAGVTEESGGWT